MNDNYLVDFNYTVKEWGTVTLVAPEGPEEAERLAIEYIKDTFEDATNIEIESIQALAMSDGR